MAKMTPAETMPLLEGEGDNAKKVLVSRTKYLRSVTKELGESLGLKELKVSDLEKILELIEKGKTAMPDGNDERFNPIFERVLADRTQRDEIEAEIKREEEEKAAAENAKKEEKKNAELALVNSAVEGSLTLDTNELMSKFSLGQRNQCVPKGDVTDTELVQMFVISLDMNNTSNWMIGDLVNQLETRGHENVTMFVCEKVGKSYSTVSGVARVCKAVKPEDRDPAVTFTNYREIFNAKFSEKAELDNKLKLELVQKTKQNNWNAQEVRAAVNTERGVEPKAEVLPHEDDTIKLLFVTNEGEVFRVVGFHKQFCKEGTYINPKTFEKYTGRGETKWKALETKERPESETETVVNDSTKTTEAAATEQTKANGKKGKK